MRKHGRLLGIIALGAMAGAADAQMGVRLDPRGGVRLGSPPAFTRPSSAPSVQVPMTFDGGVFFCQRVSLQGAPHALGIHDGLLIDGHLVGEDVRFGFGDVSGLHIDGTVDSDDFRLRLHLGSDLLLPRHRRVICYPYYPRYIAPYYPIYDLPIGPRYADFYPGYPVDYRTSYVDPRLQPAPAPSPPPVEGAPEDDASPATWGRWRLARGDLDEAIAELRRAIDDEPADSASKRLLAVALLRQGRLADGVALLRAVYREDPALTREAIDPSMFGPDARKTLDRLVRRMAIYANARASASAWLAEAVLMQAQGRDRHALRMLDKARLHGLEEDLVRVFERALTLAP